MTKKTGKTPSRSKSARSKPRRKRAGKNSVNSTTILIVAGFLLFIGAALYGLNVLKDRTAADRTAEISEEIRNRTGEIEGDIYRLFFKLGISERNIISESDQELEREGVVWSRNDKTVSLERKIDKNSISGVLGDISGSGADSLFDYTVEDTKGGYTAKINIDGYDTHRILFKFPEQKKIVKKPEKPKETTPDKKDEYDYVSKTADGKKPRISIIVDDIGINKKYVDQLAEISPDFTFAILPNRPHSIYAAKKAREKGIDVILHQPMEPKTSSGYNADDAGEGVLMVGQPKEKIESQLAFNIASVPNVIGLNNHMGSKFTENEELMRLVILKLKNEGLFYVDSLTSPNTVGNRLSDEMGVKNAKRDVFLDNKTKGKSYVKSQLRKLISKAEKNGYAIGICHPYPQTIQALSEELPKLDGKIEVTPVKSLLN